MVPLQIGDFDCRISKLLPHAPDDKEKKIRKTPTHKPLKLSSMAADIGELGSSEKKRRRRTLCNSPKLLLDHKVEVRSVEDGFRGSWHSGTVIACENQARRVQYDHLLCDDGLQHLIDCIKVPPVIDGIVPAIRVLCNHRGLIRPLPPPIDFTKWSFHYGQCVDVYYKEAWWEGVVFDHEDGSESRTIFFPDMGDEMQFRIDTLRITQDWDEFIDEWKIRGNWLFLELVEEFEQEWPLQVSVRQIWYEVRVKKAFQNLVEWTSTLKGIWKNLVWEVIVDNCKLALNHFLHELNSSGDLAQDAHGLPPSSKTHLDVISRPEADSGNSLAIVAVKNDGSDSRLLSTDLSNDGLGMNLSTSSNTPCHEETPCVSPHALPVLPFNQDEFSRLYSKLNSQGFYRPSSKSPAGWKKCFRQRKSVKWVPAGVDIVPRAKFCPNAVDEYLNNRRKSSCSLKLRMHLAYLGWKIEFMRDENVLRMRYTSPDGKSYLSLVTICKALGKAPSERLSTSHGWQPAGDEIVPRAEFCPDAINEYLEPGHRSSRTLNVRKHLAYLGWKIEFMRDGGINKMRYISPNGKSYYSLVMVCRDLKEPGSEILSLPSQDDERLSVAVSDSPFPSPLAEPPHTSMELSVTPPPSDRVVESEYCPGAVLDYYSLGSAENSDKWKCYKVKDHKYVGLQFKAKKHLSAVGWSFWYYVRGRNRELRYTSPSGRSYSSLRTACKACIDEGGTSDNNTFISRPMQNAGSRMQKKRKASGSPIKSRDDLGDDCPMRVLRSSKRARQVVVPSSSDQNPRTILSWLIDNNVVLPRAKVRYISRKDHPPIAEGRITRDGIKCSCCQKVFTLSKFEAHAGSKNHRPAANIFLEDGRSLLDCQRQLKCRNIKRNLMTESLDMKGRRHQSMNDYICSVCHFGGELVLCDQCPSSFHTSCLGLKDVPDGDWFCPSCCCGVCGRSGLNNGSKQFTDDSVLHCDQCERQYHVGCLRKKGVMNVDNYPEGSWFCNKRCEQIFLGLHKFLGKSVLVGKDNLSWTLLKYKKCDDGDHDVSDMAAVTENYSKLNVALSVMHECFEPVKEARTRRDLVEDVIFSRWSELNRLNFQGFYTVLLEKNDELITVATVRVHGEKVAEVPLVGTRFKYRRLGMCRILMNELEKKLMELGVERLVLPAVPSVLNTWTTSFGFSKMAELERLNFLDYTFLDFQGTVMCQKLLNKIHSTDLSPLTRTEQNICDAVSGSDNVDFDGNSAISEAFQTDQVEESEIMDQGPADIAGVDGSDGGSGTGPPGFLTNQQTLECIPFQNGICEECSVEGADHSECENNDGLFKCYKRRRISAC
ncbi:uncharacterized protein LOC114320619 isoform X1 [Camellia sinensis]|uniref:uncharacterized protein LOC114320619 isoform X1 n=1 Tax=Camellia sinensis TaxID=4442 RepID=UPI001036D530|nr:uncharacterized protein LOC114320619 isoform X1 [Camellia sinensis]